MRIGFCDYAPDDFDLPVEVLVISLHLEYGRHADPRADGFHQTCPFPAKGTCSIAVSKSNRA
jgi:hypothetical protein